MGVERRCQSHLQHGGCFGHHHGNVHSDQLFDRRFALEPRLATDEMDPQELPFHPYDVGLDAIVIPLHIPNGQRLFQRSGSRSQDIRVQVYSLPTGLHVLATSLHSLRWLFGGHKVRLHDGTGQMHDEASCICMGNSLHVYEGKDSQRCPNRSPDLLPLGPNPSLPNRVSSVSKAILCCRDDNWIDDNRTERIEWNRVVFFGSQFMLTTIVAFFTISPFVQKNFSNYGQGQTTTTAYIGYILSGSLLGMEILFCIWYGILHSWSNMFAQLLRFADRRFYDKWWLLGTYSKYYREWNIIVHDWATQLCLSWSHHPIQRQQDKGSAGHFLLSAVFHEYIITLTLGFYYPILFVMFAGIGIFLHLISVGKSYDNRAGNIFLFFSIFLGWSIQTVFYASEYYARQNCPPNPIMDHG